MTESPHTEPTTVGLTDEGKRALHKLTQAQVFARGLDGYRFAVGLGLAHGGYDVSDASRGTMFNVGSLDPDGSLKTAVEILRDDLDEPVYKSLERYAEWGIREMDRAFAGGDIQFAAWLRDAADSSDQPPP